MLHFFRYLIMHFAALHQNKGKPGELPAEREALWREAMKNPDYRMYPHVFNVLTQKGQHMPPYFDLLIDPYDKEAVVEAAEKAIEQIKVPSYTGAGWYAYTYKTHLNGAQNYFERLRGAEETDIRRAGASGAAVPFAARRNPALARPLAQKHRHRHHGRAAGALLGHGRQRMAVRQRLAVAGNAMDQVLSQ